MKTKAFAVPNNACMAITASQPDPDTSEQPQISVLNFGGSSMLCGREQIESLMEACQFALSKQE